MCGCPRPPPVGVRHQGVTTVRSPLCFSTVHGVQMKQARHSTHSEYVALVEPSTKQKAMLSSGVSSAPRRKGIHFVLCFGNGGVRNSTNESSASRLDFEIPPQLYRGVVWRKWLTSVGKPFDGCTISAKPRCPHVFRFQTWCDQVGSILEH